MPRILVIADDLTGAAEIAGIAVRFGLSTRLLRTPGPPPTSVDCVVYDTDSRLLDEASAGNLARLAAVFAKAGAFDLIFKKTDSVLRGSPATETEWVAAVFRRPTTLLLPQNPSRGRTVKDGRYAVNGVPLHQTEFANDPLHPAVTDDVVSLLRSPAAHCVKHDDALNTGLNVAEATTADDVRAWAGRFDPDNTLAAGGADFFEALCRRFTHGRQSGRSTLSPARPVLFVSGTASPATADVRATFAAAGQLVPMPAAIFQDGPTAETIAAWAENVAAVLARHGTAMVAVGPGTVNTAGKAKLIEQAFAAVVGRLLATTSVKTLACEGGATAAAVCDALNWKAFDIEAEMATGIVQLRSTPAAPRVIVKPGSYAWPTF